MIPPRAALRLPLGYYDSSPLGNEGRCPPATECNSVTTVWTFWSQTKLDKAQPAICRQATSAKNLGAQRAHSYQPSGKRSAALGS